jgi:N-acetylglutamate synthase-like GNAT family acetyltransferase
MDGHAEPLDIEVTSGGSHPEDVRRILDGLPLWFGRPESNEQYIASASTLPNVVARRDGEVVGVCLLKHHNPLASEIELLAVPEHLHRTGIGRRIVQHVEGELRERGVRMLEVKTYGPSGKSAEYERTRHFYEGMGFIPLEENLDIWGADNPCLILVKAVS